MIRTLHKSTWQQVSRIFHINNENFLRGTERLEFLSNSSSEIIKLSSVLNVKFNEEENSVNARKAFIVFEYLRCEMSVLKGSLPPSKNDNNIDKDLYCAFQKFVLIRFI